MVWRIDNMMYIEEDFVQSNYMLESIDYYSDLLLKYDTIWCFESGNEEKKKGLVQNVWGMIKTIINEARKIIQKGLDKISEHIRYGLMSKKRKEEFHQVQEMMKKHPKLANKKITVKNYQYIMNEYDKIEKSIVQMMNDSSVDAKGMNLKTHDMLRNLSSTASSLTAAITIDACMKFARQSPQMAQEIQQKLSKSSTLLDNIENQLGTKEREKFQQDINRLTKESTYHKLISMVCAEKEKTLDECVTEIFNDYKDALQTITNPNATKKDVAKVAKKHKDFVKTVGKSYFKNDRTRQGVNDMLDAGQQIKNTINSNKDLATFANTTKEFFKPKV